MLALRDVKIRAKHRGNGLESLQHIGWYVGAESSTLLEALVPVGGRVNRPVVRVDELRQAQAQVADAR